jgi:hypothetical protein
MAFPSAEELRALLSAARDAGCTHLKISPTGIEAEFAPKSVLQEINETVPLAFDPLDIVRREVAAQTKTSAVDLFDVVASGGRIVDAGNPDPTAAQ